MPVSIAPEVQWGLLGNKSGLIAVSTRSVISAARCMPNSEPCCAKATVLVVEDQILLRAAIAEELRWQGYAVIEAVNAEEALAVLRSPLSVDLVVTDWRMPGALDGAAFVSLARHEFSHLRVIMVSGQYPDQKIRDSLDGFFAKPVDPSELSRRVRELVPTGANRDSP
jgi:CheY-like chemotaxis protein